MGVATRVRILLGALVRAQEALADGDTDLVWATLEVAELDARELVALLERRDAA